MKRTEISEGAEVYYADSNTYEEATWGRQGKATVIMVAARNIARRHEASRYVPVEPGDPRYSKSQVLVHLEPARAGSSAEQVLVPLNKLRGPYLETWHRVQERRRAIAERQQDMQTRDNQRREESVRLARRLRELMTLPEPEGYNNRSGIDDTGRYGDGRHVTLTLEAAQAIVDRLAHLEAQVGDLTNELTRAFLAARRERSSEV